MMRKRWLPILVVLMLAFSVGLASAQAPKEYVVAVVGPMTGDSAAMGIQQRNAAQLAADEINAAGGINGRPVTIKVFDDVANPMQATVAAQRIVRERDVFMVNGHINSSCTLSALPIFERAGLVVVSPTNTAPELTKMGYGNYFRIITPDNYLVEQQVQLAIFELGKKNSAVIWENTDYGRGLRDEVVKNLERFGGVLLGDESYVAGVDRDYSAQITRFRGAGVDVVYLMGEYTAGALFVRQARTLGLNAEFIGSSGMSNPQLIEIAGEAAEGVYVLTCYDPNNPNPKSQRFTKEYEKRYGIVPGEWGAHSYDIIYMLKEAVEKYGVTSRDTLADGLRAIKAFDGVTGVMEFDEFNDVPTKRVGVMRVENGKFVTYQPTKF